MAGRTHTGGGAAQRLKRGQPSVPGVASNAEHSQLGLKSHLADRLMYLASWRYISPQRVQELAAKELADIKIVIHALKPDCGDVDAAAKELLPDLWKLAKLGTSGLHQNNINKQLACIRPPFNVPFSACTFPLKKPGGVGLVDHCEQLVIWPHKMFSAIYTHAKSAWKERICPSEDRLEQFWASQEVHPNFPRLEALVRHIPNWRRRAVPIKIHGDGCPVTGVGKSWCKSQQFYHWSSQVVGL